jgi:signal transduction histidine kinase
MRERLPLIKGELTKGELTVRTHPGQGTTIIAHMPITEWATRRPPTQ